MKYTYKLRKDIIKSEKGETFSVYGVTVSEAKSETVLAAYPDIFFDKGAAEAFVSFCNYDKLDISRLPAVIEVILP